MAVRNIVKKTYFLPLKAESICSLVTYRHCTCFLSSFVCIIWGSPCHSFRKNKIAKCVVHKL